MPLIASKFKPGDQDGESLLNKSATHRRLSIAEVDEVRKLATIRIYGKQRTVACRALCILPVDGCVRRLALRIVESRLCDSIILLCIGINSILLALEKRREPPEDPTNRAVEAISNALSGIFLAECVLKICGWGFRVYIKDGWNALDFIVVVSAVIEWMPWIPFGGLGFLRLFRVLRPLRSLNSVPEMKLLVNTTVGAVPRLVNVAALGLFIYLVFAIVGTTLMTGIFYRECHAEEAPSLIWQNDTYCWEWLKVGDGRLCGGYYDCTETQGASRVRIGYCGGHEFDQGGYAPVFQSNLTDLGPSSGGPYQWCSDDSRPTKVRPELDFVHFDHLGGAFLLIFQCMTMEGWTDLMYYVKDAFSYWFAVLYFFLLIIIASHFLLNVALAVVDEVRDDFDGDGTDSAALNEGLSFELEEGGEDVLWRDWKAVKLCRRLTQKPVWQNFVLMVITANVISMCLQQFPPNVVLQESLQYVGYSFLAVFVVEMLLELMSRGVRGYIRNPTTCFDGIVVIISLIETAMQIMSGGSGGSALQALRTLRLFRVLNKFASRNPKIAILLKAMVGTAKALRYWLVLFILVLYICTLMWMHFFANALHFEDPGSADVWIGRYNNDPVSPALEPWCELELDTPLKRRRTDWNFRQDCIPRSHFDNFGWGFVTIFQIMTGENWNVVMYSGMRATRAANQEWAFGILFVLLLLFGQTLFLSLFLSMLLAKFDDFRDSLSQANEARRQRSLNAAGSGTFATDSCAGEQVDDDDEDETANADGNADEGVAEKAERRESETARQQLQLLPSPAFSPGQTHSARPISVASSEDDGGIANNASSLGRGRRISSALRAAAEGRSPSRAPGSKEFVALRDMLVTPNSEAVSEEPGEVGKVAALEREKKRRAKRRALQRKREWPYGWSWFIFPQDFIVRKAAKRLLSVSIKLNGVRVKLFDTFILICILLSTLCMMIDFPLADPDHPVIVAVRIMDSVFACIFIVEMAVKWTAWPLIWGEGAYFWSPGCEWNWLDFVVVAVSITGFSGGGPSELKTLRILRAFRPLRVVKRMETLRNIVSAIFNSMKELGVLLIVFMLFLLIFALVFMMYLGGTLYGCSDDNVWFHRDVGDEDFVSFTLPLCVSSNASDPLQSVQVQGAWSEAGVTWNASATGECGDGPYAGFDVPWRRATPDTPVCVARCDPLWNAEFNSTYAAPPSLCPRKYETTEELPHRCGESDDFAEARLKYAAAEAVGFEYIEKMQKSFVVPCGGTTEESVADGAPPPGHATSCRTRFCPNVDPSLVHLCEYESAIHPYFCFDACRDSKDSSAKCQSCRQEYRAACECPDFCTPLIKDAALCVEQGGSWDQVTIGNFDNVWNSMLYLIAISTTEGWVDAMDAASDTQFTPYIEPLRDASHIVWIVFFVVWILFSFMFLMNLGVGIIVDKFMEMRAEGKDIISAAQLRWIKSRLSLQQRGRIFSMTNLHLLSPSRRRMYGLIEHPVFERFIMSCILLNTILMALVVFPELELPDAQWWFDMKEWANYFFAFAFALEAILKLYALRGNYWKETWNCFDFVCVIATIFGMCMKLMKTGVNLSTVASVVRIFRIARLFRLLKIKAFRNLNKLFKSLAISVVKLANVGVVAFLFLVLFSILGVSLFSTVSQDSDYFNENANFQHFPNAFITLFRASTGEAWPYVMHDLHKDEVDWFKSGSWCSPGYLFDTDQQYEVLREKCLIAQPNACVLTLLGGWNPLPWLYWVSYALFIGLVIMNVVIAVILEGYEETKSSDEAAMIDTCKNLWGSKYDQDHMMSVPFAVAIRFIVEAITLLQTEGVIGGELVEINVPECETPSGFGVDLSRFPLRFARALDVKPTERMEFHVAARQVLRFATIVESTSNEVDVIQELDQCDEKDGRKDIQRLHALEAKDAALNVEGDPLSNHIAAIMLQRIVREAIGRLRRRNRNRAAMRDDQGNEIVATKEGRIEYLRRAATAETIAQPGGLTPPAAG